MVKGVPRLMISEERLEEAKKPYFGSQMRPLQIVLSVRTERFTVEASSK